MAKSPENNGFVAEVKHLGEISRNGGLGVAAVSAFVAPALVLPALLWAGGSELHVLAIDKYQDWRAKGGNIFP